jgi:hypothetical protein
MGSASSAIRGALRRSSRATTSRDGLMTAFGIDGDRALTYTLDYYVRWSFE